MDLNIAKQTDIKVRSLTVADHSLESKKVEAPLISDLRGIDEKKSSIYSKKPASVSPNKNSVGSN